MTFTITARQKLQILQIAFPELYETAARKDSAWVSLWNNGQLIKGGEPKELIIQLNEELGTIISEPTKWTLDNVPIRIEMGIALSKDTYPRHFIKIAGVPPLKEETGVVGISGLNVSISTES